MAPVRTNREILTGGKKYAQKQAKKYGVDEVVFDKDSRQEYLTGFHKRKLQRQKKAQEYNKEQERLARIEERKKMREEKKKDIETQLKKFNETVKEITHFNDSEDEDSNKENDEDEDESWTGFGDDNDSDQNKDENSTSAPKHKHNLPKGILQHKEVYKVDQDQLFPDSNAIIDDETTVTVESIDNPATVNAQQTDLHEIAKANNVNLKKSDEILDESIKRAKNYAVLCGVAKPTNKDKVKKKKFRYLTKAERRENTRKEKSKKFSGKKK
mmetsp:Transcript_8691/g.10834  ORF Transcript_8691/g.10834 Transcript_8691/m.10834 type:complete len:270 (-) Transcript_8691:12-821(-)